MNSIESIPQVWDDERDDQFFRLTTPLFTTDFSYGASVLLASYDTDDEFTATGASIAGDTADQSSQLDSTSRIAKGAAR